MICIQNKGRLGNQLFIYALYKELKMMYPNETFVIDNSEINSFGFDNELLNYNIDKDLIFINDHKDKQYTKSFIQKVLLYYHSLRTKKMNPRELFEFEKKHQHFFNFFGLNFCTNGYIPILSLKRKRNFFLGFYQSEKYFQHVKESLLQDLNPIYQPNVKNKYLYDKMKNTNSVCLTVRRGDYVNHPVHDICNLDYFNRALNLIYDKIKNPIIFAFSDDIEWVKQNITFKGDVYFEDGTDTVYEKLRLMSSCKHFILSNSTFSWWACYLSSNDEKIVISPNKWFNIDIPCELINDKWIQLNME